MRFVHTADWQIGMAASHVGQSGNRVRMARLEAIHRVADVCVREQAEFLLIAGDTFEHNGVGRDLVAEVAGLMQQMPCPVYVIPGNHDPLHHGSVWGHPVWDGGNQVHVLAERTPVPVPGGTLYPCPLFSRRSAEDPTNWIEPSPATDGLRIGVAHGHAGETPNGDGSYPIPLDAARRAGLDYLALGHWHSTTVFAGTRIAYSGTHEQTGFGEHDSGNVLVVDLPGKGTEPIVTSVRTGTLIWKQIKESITAEGALASLPRELSQIADPASKLLQISLAGLLFRSDVDELVRIEKECARFLYARLDRNDLKPAPSDESWMGDLPVGVIRQTAQWLCEMSAVSGQQSQIATQSLLELYAMASEVAA